jgi:hypothetical protein
MQVIGRQLSVPSSPGPNKDSENSNLSDSRVAISSFLPTLLPNDFNLEMAVDEGNGNPQLRLISVKSTIDAVLRLRVEF